jgi:hypothetical protein
MATGPLVELCEELVLVALSARGVALVPDDQHDMAPALLGTLFYILLAFGELLGTTQSSFPFEHQPLPSLKIASRNTPVFDSLLKPSHLIFVSLLKLAQLIAQI